MTLKLFHRSLGKELIVTLVYVKCDAVERIELWDSMYHLAFDMEYPWLVGGDFNVILSKEEKYGGLPVYLSEVEDFAHCMILDSKGVFMHALEVKHLIKYGSDPAPLLFSCNVNIVQVRKSFKFLNFWTRHESFLKSLSFIQQLKIEPKLHKVEVDLTRYYHLEEELWRKKAGMQWFKDRDRNIKYFHAHVKEKRKRLQVSRILDNNGNLIDSQEEIPKEAMDFFQAQFTEERIPTDFDIVKHVPKMGTDEQNSRLWAEPGGSQACSFWLEWGRYQWS
ncbi:uncharacterized protein [Nicotiana sylvestris]|uniref:uncharacterized protein n=1 Tax=Nicotiana sylvestris TaxID=4096 RepID=UPI00388C9615